VEDVRTPFDACAARLVRLMMFDSAMIPVGAVLPPVLGCRKTWTRSIRRKSGMSTQSIAHHPSGVAVRLRLGTLGPPSLVAFGGGASWLAFRNPSIIMLGFLLMLGAAGLSAQMWLGRDNIERNTHLASPLPVVGVIATSVFWPATSLERTIALLLAVAAGVLVSASLEYMIRSRNQLQGSGRR
jgi:hypothetical protein